LHFKYFQEQQNNFPLNKQVFAAIKKAFEYKGFKE
jgi:hypothetical protein